MKTHVIRLVAVAVLFALFFFVSEVLMVPPVRIASLAAWGLLCMLYSYELGGSRRVYRYKYEERGWLERAWLIAGLGCIVGAVALKVIYFYS
jgi:hypothetical protein